MHTPFGVDSVDTLTTRGIVVVANGQLCRLCGTPPYSPFGFCAKGLAGRSLRCDERVVRRRPRRPRTMALSASTVVVESCVEVSRYGAYAHKRNSSRAKK
eukprot:scaffold30085_cov63-Phaeocystis_antarctica.AAC.3